MLPEEIATRTESYGMGFYKIVNAIKEFPEEMWQFKPSASEWSIHEIIIHLADSEANSYIRCRRFIAEPGSPVLGYDQNNWAKHLSYHSQNTEDALELFKYLRTLTYALIKSQPESIWNNTVEHSERGTMKFTEWLQVYDDHVTGHINQMRRVYNNWKTRAVAE